MKNSVKKVFVVGGTGFLGYYSSLEFLKSGIAVSTLSRKSEEVEKYLPREMNVVEKNLDIFEVSQEELKNVFQGYDAMIYSVGPDDRVVPPAPAYDFFHEKLVVQCAKVVKAAKSAGVKRVVIMNSYFAYFDRQFDGLLSKNHAYVRARIEQAQACISLGDDGSMDVMILELPYIFGSMPGRTPLWKDVFLEKFKKMKTIYFPKGGTVIAHVRDVARSVVAATLKGKHGGRYPIGVVNMKFKEMIEIMYSSLGISKKVKTVPTFLAYLNGISMKKKAKKEGKEAGLDYAKLMTDIMSKDFFYSKKIIEDIQNELGFQYGFDVKEGIEIAMKSCYPEKFPDFDPSDQIKNDLEVIKEIWGRKD